MHSIPLARAGHQVLAIDTSEYLLTELRTHSVGLSVRAVAADLLDFRSHMGGLADLILCMGDTLTHLADHAQVEELMRDVARSLQPQGTFIATFRDYTRLPSGDDSFILVRSDTCRIHTCHLQDAGEHVAVSDVLHELVDGTWSMSVSTYKKLRLTPSAAVAAAENAGLRCIVRSGPRGMVELQASIAE
jgi:SAM-dependent methyltransferase